MAFLSETDGVVPPNADLVGDQCEERADPETTAREVDCAIRGRKKDVACRAYLFSAKGAAVTSSLGQRPRDSCNGKPPVLKARFIPGAIWVGLTANRCVESRFQRWSTIRSESWGDAPGLDEGAPLALNRYRRAAASADAIQNRTRNWKKRPRHPAAFPDGAARRPYDAASTRFHCVFYTRSHASDGIQWASRPSHFTLHPIGLVTGTITGFPARCSSSARSRSCVFAFSG